MFWKVVAACCVLALAIVGCSRADESGGGNVPSPAAAAESFDPKVVDDFVAKLAGAGIGVYELGSSTPVVPVAEPVSPVRLTEEQAANLAAGAWAGAGQTGAEIDTLVKTDPLTPGAEPIPASLLIIGWAQVAPGQAAKLAKELLGKQDWRNYGSVVVPTAVLLLFAADVTRAVAEPTAGAGGGAGVRPAGPQVSVCEKVKNFVYGTIDEVFKAIGHIELKGYNGNVLSDILTFFRNVGASVINFGIDKIKTVVVNGVELVFGPVLRAIAAVAGVVAVAGNVLSTVKPWFGRLTPDPGVYTRGTAAQPGVLTLHVSAGGLQDWPNEIAGCARAVNVTLPPLKPQGGKVDWKIDFQYPSPMIKQISDTRSLAENGTANLRFETLPESPEVAAGETQYNGSVQVRAVVHRTELDEVHKRITTYLLAQLPPLVAQHFGPWIHSILDPRIKALIEPLAKLRDTTTGYVIPVNYHTPDEDPKRRPSSRPSSEPGRKAVIPLACPSHTTVGHGFSSLGHIDHLEAEPGVVLACGYESRARTSLAIGVLDRRRKPAGSMEQISITGTDAGWIDCDDRSGCLIYAVVGDRVLTVTGAADRAAAVDITKRVLGVR